LEERQFRLSSTLHLALLFHNLPLSMEASRRKFIRQLLAGSAGALVGAQAWAHAPSEEVPRLHTAPGLEPDWAAVRSQFQFLRGQVYLNSGTLGLLPQPVLDAMAGALRYLREGSYTTPPSVREAVASLVNAPKECIVLTHNTTHGINLVAQGLPLRRGDELILSDQEHVGNALPWLNRARIDRLRIGVLTPGPDAATTLLALDRLVTKRTRVIALPHITCTNGQVLPMAEIVARYQDRVPHIFVDGAHGPGTVPLDFQRLNCGYYAGCGHKWLCGPAGTGFLYIRPDLLEQLQPRFTGAGSDNGWTLDSHTQAIQGWAKGAQRFEVGTQNRVALEGLGAAIAFWDGIGWEAVHARMRTLQAHLRARIVRIPGMEILTPEEGSSSASMLTFRAMDVARRLPLLDYLQSTPQFRIRKVLESELLAVRISTHAFNTLEEMDALADVLEAWRV
jgi:cysteine desulfurase / selenocysteine lyase